VNAIPIDEFFFCDGASVVLVSQSLGGSGMEPAALADALRFGDAETMNGLLARGVCLPLFFGSDCALDGVTSFVIGELDEPHERAWVARLTGKLAIPDGKLVLVCGGGDGEELARAISGVPADPDYWIYQSLDVPPGDHRVDVLAYAKSVTVALMHDDIDDPETIRALYAGLPEVQEHFVVQLTPLSKELPAPGLIDDIGWPGVFVRREP
jgi:hypothetical protein